MTSRALFPRAIALAGLVVSLVAGVVARAQLTLVEIGGELDLGNIASIDNGGEAFAIDALIDAGFDAHTIAGINDGIYGNSNSWIGNTAAPIAFAGVRFDGSFEIASVAWGRDNGGEPDEFVDRWPGTYVLEYTTVPAPDATTPEEDWVAIGEVVYDDLCPPTPWLRHRWDFPAVEATGVRLVVPAAGLGSGTCIDELEVYESPLADALEPCERPEALELVGAGGPRSTPATAGDATMLEEGNLARAPDAIAFGSPPHPAPVHEIAFANDGLYGNANSWLGNEPGPTSGLVYVGVFFADGSREIEEIALGRDNTDGFRDRAVGSYVVQTTLDDLGSADDAAVAAADWVDVGVANAHLADGLPHLRHHYRFSAREARAIRVVTALGNAIDELEVGKLEVDDEKSPPPESLELVETGGPDGTPAAPEDVPDTSAGNLALIDTAIPFASPPIAPREVFSVVDGRYGDANAWAGETPAGPFDLVYAGVWFASGPRLLAEIAIGRDNTGEIADRADSPYIVQVTGGALDPADPASIEAARWTTVGQADAHLGDGSPGLRRRYSLGLVNATGVRVVVDPGTAIDEIELYSLDDSDVLELVESGGAMDAENLSLLEGSTAFAIDSLTGFDIHATENLNDGLYGNENSWIGNSGAPAFAGIRFPGLETVASFAFGRDNGGELMQFTDRSLGVYVLQFTTFEGADETTPSSEWTTIGALEYSAIFPPDAAPFLRHRYNFTPVEATAMRLIVPLAGIAGGTCIDELEFYEEPGDGSIDPGLDPLELVEVGGPIVTPALPFDVPTIADGNFSGAPDVLPFGSPSNPAPAHAIAHLNDGFYGNDNSWLGDTPGEVSGEVYCGLVFMEAPRVIGEIALGRDNTGTVVDRFGGPYIVEYTTELVDPASDADVAAIEWTPIGQAVDHVSGEASPVLRRRYRFDPVEARALRVRTLLGNAIDELEIYRGEPVVARPEFRRGDADVSGTVDITDGIFILNFLFIGGPAPRCDEAADADDDGVLNLTDGVVVLNFLFIGAAAPPAPGPVGCGVDPGPVGGPRDLGCEEYDACG